MSICRPMRTHVLASATRCTQARASWPSCDSALVDPYPPPPGRHRGLLKNRFRRHGIYWLPNLITSGALFAGFYAIVQAMNGRFEQAAMAIFVAMVLDGLDGR